MQIFIIVITIMTIYGKQGFGPGIQEWGYIEVRPQAHMFYWLYKTTARENTRPLILWLQGGPGCSSTGFGNFLEVGPLHLNQTKRCFTLVKDYNVLFIDNPVGTGFSNVNKESLLVKNNKEIAVDLVKFISLFFDKFPDLQKCPLRIVGESYGGKMATEFALMLFQVKFTKANVVSITLIDSWISPLDSVSNYASYLYYSGRIDRKGKKDISKAAYSIKRAIFLKNYRLATAKWQYTLKVIANVTDNVDFYNVINQEVINSEINKRDLEMLMNGPVRRALGVNATWYLDSPQVFNALKGDFMKPVVWIVKKLLATTSINVQVVTGELDLIVNTPGTLQWIKQLFSINSTKWNKSKKFPLGLDCQVEGYKKNFGKFTLYWIRRAGHMVPIDNPRAMKAILDDSLI